MRGTGTAGRGVKGRTPRRRHLPARLLPHRPLLLHQSLLPHQVMDGKTVPFTTRHRLTLASALPASLVTRVRLDRMSDEELETQQRRVMKEGRQLWEAVRAEAPLDPLHEVSACPHPACHCPGSPFVAQLRSLTTSFSSRRATKKGNRQPPLASVCAHDPNMSRCAVFAWQLVTLGALRSVLQGKLNAYTTALEEDERELAAIARAEDAPAQGSLTDATVRRGPVGGLWRCGGLWRRGGWWRCGGVTISLDGAHAHSLHTLFTRAAIPSRAVLIPPTAHY